MYSGANLLSFVVVVFYVFFMGVYKMTALIIVVYWEFNSICVDDLTLLTVILMMTFYFSFSMNIIFIGFNILP